MIQILSVFNEWGVLIMRLLFGIIFLAHGWGKLRNLKATQEWFHSIGYKPGVFWGTLVAVVETSSSIAVMLGLYTQIAGALLAIVMVNSTLWRKKSGDKLVGGYELDLALLAIAIFLTTNGAGIYSLDSSWGF